MLQDIITRLALGFGSLIACLLLSPSQQLDQSERLIGVVKDDAVIQLPAEIVLTSPLRIQDADRVTLKGPTTVRYRGPSTAPGAFILARCGYCTVKDVTLIVEADVESAVLVTNLPGASQVGKISTANTFERVRVIHAGQTAAPKRAFSVDSRPLGGADSNNEFHTFIQCQALNFTEAGFYLWGSQAHRIRYQDCDVDGVHNGGQIGLHSEHGVYFDWNGGTINRCKTNFRLGTMHTRAVVRGMNSEHCQRFLWLGTSGNSAPLSVENCRWDGEPPASGDPWFFAWTLGHVRFEDNVITSSNGIMPQVVVNCYQRGSGSQQKRMYGVATVRGNTFQVQNLKPGESSKPVVSVPAAWNRSDVEGNLFIPWGGIEQQAKVARTP